MTYSNQIHVTLEKQIKDLPLEEQVEYLKEFILEHFRENSAREVYEICQTFQVTPIPAKLFLYLQTHPGYNSRDQIMHGLYGFSDSAPNDNIVSVYVHRLNKAFRNLDKPFFVKNRWGGGYELLTFNEEEFRQHKEEMRNDKKRAKTWGARARAQTSK